MDLMNIIMEDNDQDEMNLIVYGIPRRIYTREDYFHSFHNRLFYQRFRVSKDTALYILNLIEADIEYPYNLNNAVSPINQLLFFLRVAATGSHIACVADFGGFHVSTACRIIVRVGRALASLYDRFIKMPQNEEEINTSNLEFYDKARFPRIIGVIDGTHIRIQSPGGNDPEVFRNRKGYFSINTQIIGNANLKIINLVARWPGSAHDLTILINSRVRQQFENLVYRNSLLLGDSGYNNRSYLLTPLENPQTRAEQLYNEAHIRTRNIIERLIGVWKRRFPALAYGLRLKLETTQVLIVALAILHNICREQNEEDPPDPEDVQRFVQVMNQDEVPNVPPFNDHFVAQGFEVRRNFIQNYFHSLIE